MKKEPVECVMFDKDGTLIECASIWIPWLEDIYEYVSERISQPIFSYNELAQTFGIRSGNNRIDPRGPLAIGSVLEGEIILSLKLYESGVSWDRAVLLAAEAASFANEKQNHSSAIQLIEGVKELISLLHKKKILIGVLTADDTSKAEQHLKAIELYSYFDFIIGSDQVERGKPFPDMAYVASEKFNFSLSNSLIIGDTNADMRLGKNAGMKAAIGFIPETEEKKDYLLDADLIISHFDYQLIESFFE